MAHWPLRNRSSLFPLFLSILLIFLFQIKSTNGNLMGVDFGSAFLKVSIARPGKGIELVTNEQSKRKTPAAIGFTLEGERLFGDAALSYAAKAPDRVMLYGRDYLGKCAKDTEGEEGVVDYGCEKAKWVVDGVGEFGGEQIVAMLLTMARKHAAVALSGKGDADPKIIKDAVITIPPWFNVKQRGEMLDAAELIDLNVLSLVNTPTAALLKYALDNKGMKAMVERNGDEKKIGSTVKQKVLVYDAGASSTSATVAEITSNVKQKRATRLEILDHQWTRKVGGKVLDEVVVEKLCSIFDERRSEGAEKCASLPRVLVRLRKAAQRAREVLSANTDAHVNIPSLHEDEDFKASLKRTDYEEAAAKLFEEGLRPLQTALKSSTFGTRGVDAIVPIGGVSRTPKIQEGILKEIGTSVLNKSLNADESAVLGAAYYAASLSSTFRVREISLQDINMYSISAQIDRDRAKSGLFGRKTSDDKVDTQKVKIFEAKGKMPSRKSVTLKRSGDFGVKVFLDDDQKTLLLNFQVKGVDKVLKKVQDDKLAKSVVPKVSLTFQLDTTGMVKVSAAEAAVDESITITYTPSPSSTITQEPSASATDGKAESKEQTPEAPSAIPSPTTKVQTVVHREAVVVQYDQDTVSSVIGRLSSEVKNAAAKFLKSLDIADVERVQLADTLNSLESEILSTRSRIREAHDAADDEETDEQALILKKVTTAEERTKVLEMLDSLEDWMFSEGSQKLAAVKQKKDELVNETKDLFSRATEYTKRPQAIESMRSALKKMKTTAEPLQQLHLERNSNHIPTFEKFTQSLTEAEGWLSEKIKEQEKLLHTDKPAFSIADLEQKSRILFIEFASLGRLTVPESPTPSASLSNENKGTDDATENGTSSGGDQHQQGNDGDPSKVDAGGVSDSKDEL